MPEAITEDTSKLPQGGGVDEEYWIGLPSDSAKAKMVRSGDLVIAEVYHVKSVRGKSTDIVMWVFYLFNGPGSLKLMVAVSLS
ncbi:hypothetical protein SUGI_0017110 [Cryptomeria japonica]|nr:hypothetical protein SUGI_0017110 [Cryptomeria japonica]